MTTAPALLDLWAEHAAPAGQLELGGVAVDAEQSAGQTDIFGQLADIEP